MQDQRDDRITICGDLENASISTTEKLQQHRSKGKVMLELFFDWYLNFFFIKMELFTWNSSQKV